MHNLSRMHKHQSGRDSIRAKPQHLFHSSLIGSQLRTVELNSFCQIRVIDLINFEIDNLGGNYFSVFKHKHKTIDDAFDQRSNICFDMVQLIH